MATVNSEMLAVLDRFGISHEEKNNYAVLLDHDSFNINLEKNYWKHFKTNAWGHYKPSTDPKTGEYLPGFVEYLRDEFNYDIPEDVEVSKKERVKLKVAPIKPFDENSRYYANSDRDSYKYLLGRGISADLIKGLLDKKLIGTDIHHNLNYYWENKDGHVVGEDIQGTVFKKDLNARGSLKLIASGSQRFFGFNFQTGDNPTALCVFEAPIDMLSYFQTHRQALAAKQVAFLSLSGAAQKAATVPNMIREMGWSQISTIVVGTDKDEAGEEAYDAIKNIVATVEELKGTNVARIYPQVGKDWNDQLKHDVFGWEPSKDGSNEHEAPKDVSLQSPSR